jgi:hypothetical protein
LSDENSRAKFQNVRGDSWARSQSCRRERMQRPNSRKRSAL